MSSVLIIEDSPSDLKYYEPLFRATTTPPLAVSLLFVAPDNDYSEKKLKEVAELLYEDVASKIKHYAVCTKETVREFLTNSPYDFYILDSLGGFAEELVKGNDVFKGHLCFLSSTTPFRESMERKGYRAYKKEDIGNLIKDCFLSRD